MTTEATKAILEDNKKRQLAYDAWVHIDFLCKNYILNCHSDALYSAYCTVSTIKRVVGQTIHNYNAQDTGTKKIVGKFLNFKIVTLKLS